MRPQDLIRKKRDGAAFSFEEMRAFVCGVTDESWADYQITALIMAMFLNGLNGDESRFLTKLMLHSGEILDFSDVDAPKADKHSTGGVGDKTSLIIAPLAAAGGVAVPMISGRGLGHTGGTLDKLESIRGYNVNLSLRQLKETVKACGFAMTGQTAEIVPADKKLYALRDATATVESIPLIVASIMSKKLAEDLDALVLDVKTGNGAFMSEFAKSKQLAEAMCAAGNACGVKTAAVISDMNQPLGKFVGNALEVYESIKILRGEIENDFRDTWNLSLELAARMLVLTEVAESLDAALQKCEENLRNGAALEKLRKNIELQNGDPRICDKPELLFTKDLHQIPVKSARSGFVSEINTKTVGEVICELGGGRTKVEDKIDYAVGYQCAAKIGDLVNEGEILGVLYSRTPESANAVYQKLQSAYRLVDKAVAEPQLIQEIIL